MNKMKCPTLILFLLWNMPTFAIDTMDIHGLIDKAVHHHPAVGAAAAEHRVSQENLNAAKYNLYPTPSVSTNYMNQDGATSRVGIRQPLWTGGKLTANINQSLYNEKASEVGIFEQQNTVAKNTIDIWQSYIYAVGLQRLHQNNLNLLKEFDDMMTRRVQQGVSAQIDLDLVKNRALQDLNAYQAAQQQQRIAEARLLQMVGEDLDDGSTHFPLSQMLAEVKQQSYGLESLVFAPQPIAHPSIIKQQHQIEASKQQIKIQKAENYPNLYAQYEQVYNHKTGDNDGQISFGLSYSPGAGFSNLASTRASQAKVESLEQTQQATMRQVMENLQVQYQQLISARDQEQSLLSAVAGADLVIASYRRQFIAGRKSWLEVLNAVRDKANYEQQLLQVQSQMIGAFYKLQVDLGTMAWQKQFNLTQNVVEYRPIEQFKQQWQDVKSNINTPQPMQKITQGLQNIMPKFTGKPKAKSIEDFPPKR